MAKETFNKNESLVAACFLASNIDGSHDVDENRLIYDMVMLNGERMILRVDHDTFFRKWNYFMAAGGLERIEKELINTLKKCSRDFTKKVIAYMENVTYASRDHKTGMWQDKNEDALISRFAEALDLSRTEIKELRKTLY